MSGHLVQPVQTETDVGDLANDLRDAHRFLVAAARKTIPRLIDLPARAWGSACKREHVVLPRKRRPSLVSENIERHSFAEVMNQCATLERLIDTLSWAQEHAPLQRALAVRCNATTSSAPRKKGQARDDDDHDLVLKDTNGVRWKFEVSDVASEKDGNGKERKDLVSLGVLAAGDDDVPGWPDGRNHLVVSSEFAVRLSSPTRHGLRLGLFHYVQVKDDGETRIFEVREGRDPSAAARSANSRPKG